MSDIEEADVVDPFESFIPKYALGSHTLNSDVDLSAIPYSVSSSKRVQVLEVELTSELEDLKHNIEENQTGFNSRNPSSLPLPKDETFFRKQRELVIRRSLQVLEPRKFSIQAFNMKQEMSTVSGNDYKTDGIPLLLHQFFLMRMQQVVHEKHMHMLRWKRFADDSTTMAELFPFYTNKLERLHAEYNDYEKRVQALEPSVMAAVNGDKDQANSAPVDEDDLLIYMRWLITHFTSMQTFHKFTKMIEWIPIQDKHEILDPGSSCTPKAKPNDNLSMATFAMNAVSNNSSNASLLSKADTSITHLTRSVIESSSMCSIIGLKIYTSEEYDGLMERIPQYTMDLQDIKPCLQTLLDIYSIDMTFPETEADEVVLYSNAKRRFRSQHSISETLMTFKTYNRVESKPGEMTWGEGHSSRALLQTATWVPFIRLKPKRELNLLKHLVLLRQKQNSKDEIILYLSKFIQASNADKIIDTLKTQETSLKSPDKTKNISLAAQSTPTTHTVGEYWKDLYTNPELFAKQGDDIDIALAELDEEEMDKVKVAIKPKPQAVVTRRKKGKDGNTYDYKQTIAMLGLDEGEEKTGDMTSFTGAYLGFTLLRFIRTKDLRRNALGILNYLRSVERTLTINDGGLSLEAGSYRETSSQNHRTGNVDGNIGGGHGLGTNNYIHYSPRNYKINESKFITYAGVENHDDFYTCDDDGLMHVQDQRGLYIMYDVSLEDLESLSDDLELIVSYYIDKHICSTVEDTCQSSATNFNMGDFASKNTDRFQILYDIWLHEVTFLQCKKELLDCHLEAYHHVFDKDEKRKLAQVITDLIHLRPKYDFKAVYFTQSYKLHCSNLLTMKLIVKTMLDRQIKEQREYIKVINSGSMGTAMFGMPESIHELKPILINNSRAALKPVYILEFHPSLCIASRIMEIIEHGCLELYHMRPGLVNTEVLRINRDYLNIVLSQLRKMTNPGTSYTGSVQRDVFRNVIIGDPTLMTEIALSQVNPDEFDSSMLTPKVKQDRLLKIFSAIYHMITLRHRLIFASLESAILAKIYKKQMAGIQYDDFHLYLRFIDFEEMHVRNIPVINKPSDTAEADEQFQNQSVHTVSENDFTCLDKYTPQYLSLAINEIDNVHIGKINFRSRENIIECLSPENLAGLETSLLTQVVHKNSLISIVQLMHVCQPHIEIEQIGKLVTSYNNNFFLKMSQISLRSQIISYYSSIYLLLNDFPSIRDTYFMIGSSTDKTNISTIELVPDPRKLKKLPRQVLSTNGLQVMNIWYIPHYTNTLRLYKKLSDPEITTALRKHCTIVASLHDIIHYLCAYACLGEEPPQKKKCETTNINKQRKENNKNVTEESPLLNRENISAQWGGAEGIGTELREIQQQMKFLNDPSNPEEVAEFLSTRRDVMFMIFDTAVRHCMTETFLATNNTDAYKRLTDTMFYGLHELSDVMRPSIEAVMLPIPEPFEARDGVAIEKYPWRASLHGRAGPYPIHLWNWKHIGYNMQLCLAGLKDVHKQHCNGEILGVSLLLEEVLIAGYNGTQTDNNNQLTKSRQSIRPASSTINDLIDVQKIDADRSKSVTMTNPAVVSGQALQNSSDQPINNNKATGSIISTTSQVKQTKSPSVLADHLNQPRTTSALSQASSVASYINMNDAMHSSQGKAFKISNKSNELSRILHPMKSYKLMKEFMLLWKRLQLFKFNWATLRYEIDEINNSEIYKNFQLDYRKEILIPVLLIAAQKVKMPELYDDIININDPLPMPPGVSEFEIKSNQLVRLLEHLECTMIMKLRRKITQELAVVATEMTREESTLPVDLWKKNVFKEAFAILKPHISVDFAARLYSEIAACSDVLPDENAISSPGVASEQVSRNRESLSPSLARSLAKSRNESSISNIGAMPMVIPLSTITRDSSLGGIDHFQGVTGQYVTFKRSHVESCLSLLSSEVMIRERSNYDNYSAHYESLMRNYQQKLYQKEQEIKQLKQQLKTAQNTSQVSMQCQLAETSESLIVEVMALRNKVKKMNLDNQNLARDIREQVRYEYSDLVHDLFGAAFDIKQKYDVFREQIYQDILQSIEEARTEALESLAKMSAQNVDGQDVYQPEECNQKAFNYSQHIHRLQKEIRYNNVTQMKTKALTLWRHYADMQRIEELQRKMRNHALRSQVDSSERKEIADSHLRTLKQQQCMLHLVLRLSEEDREQIKKELEKEIKSKQEKLHSNSQKIISEKKLQEAKKANLDKLIEQLQDKDQRLMLLSTEHSKLEDFQKVSREDIKKKVTDVKRQLNRERSLKMDAYQRVDELQTQIYDFENDSLSRPRTGNSMSLALSSKNSRSGSAQRPSSKTSIPYGNAMQRSLTPAGRGKPHPPSGDLRQRPKTTIGRLRHRLYDQLIHDLSPPDHAATIRSIEAGRTEVIAYDRNSSTPLDEIPKWLLQEHQAMLESPN